MCNLWAYIMGNLSQQFIIGKQEGDSITSTMCLDRQCNGTRVLYRRVSINKRGPAAVVG